MQNTTAAAPALKTTYSLLWDESAIIDDKAKDLLNPASRKRKAKPLKWLRLTMISSNGNSMIFWKNLGASCIGFLPKGNILSRAKIWAGGICQAGRLLKPRTPAPSCPEPSRKHQTGHCAGSLTAGAAS